MINELLEGKKVAYVGKSSEYYTPRCCHHDLFVVCGGEYYETDSAVQEIIKLKSSENFEKSEVFCLSEEKRYEPKAVYVKGSVFLFGGKPKGDDFSPFQDKIFKMVEKICLFSKKCEVVADITDINKEKFWRYSVCAYADKIHIIDGKNVDPVNHCIEFDTNNYAWKYKRGMLQSRENCHATVFEERIVVTGGRQLTNDNRNNNEFDFPGLFKTLKSVEVYDRIDDS